MADLSGTERVLCAVCGSLESEAFPWGTYHLNLIPPFAVSRCTRCSALFLSPRPDKENRAALFGGQVPELLRPYSQVEANYSAVTKGREALFSERVVELGAIFRKKGDGARLLDVGASAGTFVEQALTRGWDAFGVEPSSSGAAAALSAGLRVPRGLAESLPFASETFDVVHSHHVFEHLADPFLAAREIYRVLKPGGLVFIEVPNQLSNIMFRRDMLFKRVPQRERNIRSIHHLWFFSRSSLPELLERAGFHNVRARDRYSWQPRGLRAPLTYLMQQLGKIFYGGPLVQAYAWKPNTPA